MRVRFLENFDFRPPERKGRTTIAYKARWEGTVRRCCGEAAVRKGRAIEMAEPAATKQSSPELSSLAARYLGMNDATLRKAFEADWRKVCSDLRRIAASVVAQDETKGQR